jgi:two-component system LytT family response regulator
MNIINIPVGSGKKVLLAKNIVRIESAGNYSKIYTNYRHEPYLVAKVLRWFEQNLPQELFIRVHKSHLVNALFMEEFAGDTSMYCTILLKNGETIAISRRKKNSFLSHYTFFKKEALAGMA